MAVTIYKAASKLTLNIPCLCIWHKVYIVDGKSITNYKNKYESNHKVIWIIFKNN